jgi:hypothetical protein
VNRESSVGITMDYVLECRGSNTSIGKSSTASLLALEPTQPPIQWVTKAISLGVKRPGRQADHSLPSSAKINNVGAIPAFLFSLRTDHPMLSIAMDS